MRFTALLMLGLTSTCYAQETSGRTARQFASACKAYLQLEAGGRELAEQSEEKALIGLVSAGYCSGYITGFIGGGSHARLGVGDEIKEKICIPEGVTTTQIARVLVRRIEEKPELEHVPELFFVAGYLQTTWPCH